MKRSLLLLSVLVFGLQAESVTAFKKASDLNDRQKSMKLGFLTIL